MTSSMRWYAKVYVWMFFLIAPTNIAIWVSFFKLQQSVNCRHHPQPLLLVRYGHDVVSHAAVERQQSSVELLQFLKKTDPYRVDRHYTTINVQSYLGQLSQLLWFRKPRSTLKSQYFGRPTIQLLIMLFHPIQPEFKLMGRVVNQTWLSTLRYSELGLPVFNLLV